MPSASRALLALRDGNQRFTRDLRSVAALATRARREALTVGQSPSAIILSCSDSRVPAEIVFDCGLGELFSVRVAGNVCAPSLVGSVEFAAEKFGTQLIVVMGHTLCGAVDAAVSVLENGNAHELSTNVRDLLDRIIPAIQPLLDLGLERRDLLRMATRANVAHTVDQLRHASPVLEHRIARGELMVAGAEYALESGVVDFFDVPAAISVRTPTIAPRRTPSISV